jgi:hypothetical protein
LGAMAHSGQMADGTGTCVADVGDRGGVHASKPVHVRAGTGGPDGEPYAGRWMSHVHAVRDWIT